MLLLLLLLEYEREQRAREITGDLTSFVRQLIQSGKDYLKVQLLLLISLLLLCYFDRHLG